MRAAGVIVMLDGGAPDRAVHPLDLVVDPRAMELGEPMLDAVFATDLVEAVDAQLDEGAAPRSV